MVVSQFGHQSRVQIVWKWTFLQCDSSVVPDQSRNSTCLRAKIFSKWSQNEAGRAIVKSRKKSLQNEVWVFSCKKKKNETQKHNVYADACHFCRFGGLGFRYLGTTQMNHRSKIISVRRQQMNPTCLVPAAPTTQYRNRCDCHGCGFVCIELGFMVWS